MAAEALGSPEGWPPRRYGGTVADCVPHRRAKSRKMEKRQCVVSGFSGLCVFLSHGFCVVGL